MTRWDELVRDAQPHPCGYRYWDGAQCKETAPAGRQYCSKHSGRP